MVNHLGIALGDTPEEILSNLDQGRFDPEAVALDGALASDPEYIERVREVDASTPSRFNSDTRRLHEASGSAGKLAVFAVRVDTFDKPKAEQVFYVGTNEPEQLNEIRRRFPAEVTSSPRWVSTCTQAGSTALISTARTLIWSSNLGTGFLPRFIASRRCLIAGRENPGLPHRPADRLLQRLAQLWPDHLPKRMREYRKLYEHHLIVVGADKAIAEIRQVLHDVTREEDAGAFFECSPGEGDAHSCIVW